MAVTTAVIVAGAAVGSSIEQRKRAKKAEAARRKEAKLQRSQAVARSAAERRKQVKQARIQRAIRANQAGVTGTGGSSAAITGTQAITGQAQQNIGNINVAQQQGTALSEARQRTADANQVSDAERAFNTIGQVGSIFQGG